MLNAPKMNAQIQDDLRKIIEQLTTGNDTDQTVGAILNLTLAAESNGLTEELGKHIIPWGERIASVIVQSVVPECMKDF